MRNGWGNGKPPAVAVKKSWLNSCVCQNAVYLCAVIEPTKRATMAYIKPQVDSAVESELVALLIAGHFHRNVNGITVLWPGEESITYEASWGASSSGMPSGDVLLFDWGFQLFTTHGLIAPPSRMNFPKYATEESFAGAFERLYAFMKLNNKPQEALAPYSNSWD